MLVLTRKGAESIYIGDDIKITITKINAHHVRIGIKAPDRIPVHREEVYQQILELELEQNQ